MRARPDCGTFVSNQHDRIVEHRSIWLSRLYRGDSMRKKVFAAFCLLFLTCGLPAKGFPQTPAPPKVSVLTLLGRPIQFTVAAKQGYFAKYGIEVDTNNKKNSDELRADLAAGKGDLAYLAVDNAVAMVELAKVDVVIVMGGEGSQNEL